MTTTLESVLSQYKESQSVREWIEEGLIAVPGAREATGKVYASYKAWSEQKGRYYESHRVFSRSLMALGIRNSRSTDGRVFLGFRLRAPEPEQI